MLKLASLDGHRIRIMFNRDRDTTRAVEKIFGSRFNNRTKHWTAPVTMQSINELIEAGFTITGRLRQKMGMPPELLPIDVPGMKRELRRYQKQGVNFFELHNGTGLLADEQGLGKGQPKTAKILTPNGWQEIGTLTIGDRVIGSNGTPVNITGVYHRGILPTYKVTLNDQTSLLVDGEHLWAVKTANDINRGGSYRILKTSDLIGTEVVYSREGHANRKWRIPIVAPISFEMRQEGAFPIDPYLLGVMLGDGHLTVDCPNIFTPGDDYVPVEVKKVIPSGYYLNRLDYPNQATSWRIAAPHPSLPNVVGNSFKKWGLSCTKSHEKFIPEDYLFACVEKRIALLQGLIDTDGEIRPDGWIGFSSSSKELAMGIKFLIESLGGQTRYSVVDEPVYTYKGKKRIGRPAHLLSAIKLPPNICPTRAHRHRWKPKTKYHPRRMIDSIVRVEDQEIVCISVDAPDQLYITENCIVTHNTITALAYLQLHPELRPVLLVVPASVKLNWRDEALSWIEDDRIEILSGHKPWVPTGRILIINYDILHYWLPILLKLKIAVVICDEAQVLRTTPKKHGKNTANKGRLKSGFRTDAVKQLLKKQGVNRRFMALTGTPIINRPIEYFNVLNMIAPHVFSSRWSFAERYCGLHHDGRGWNYSGDSNTIELHRVLTQDGYIMLRRLKEDVAKELPSKIHGFVPMEVTAKEFKEYCSARDAFTVWVRQTKGKLAADAALRSLALTKLTALKLLAAKAKLASVLDWIGDVLESGEKLVVFAIHHEIIDKIMAEFGSRAVKIDGRIPTDQRQAIVKRFQEDPDIDLFVGGMKPAGVGITLTASSTVGIIELPYSPVDIDQAEDRVHRIGQTKMVNVSLLLAEGTIDKRLVEILDAKRKVISQVIEGREVDDFRLIDTLIREFDTDA